MNIIIAKTYQELSAKAAHIISGQILRKKDSVLGLATGSTPIDTYKNLVKMYNEHLIDFSMVKTFNLDEYYGIDKNNEQSYHYYMMQNLFNHININYNNINIPNGNCTDIILECEEYEEKIDKAGGIDLQVLGIGDNGHIGFNEPAEKLNYYTHLANLSPTTIKANSKFFNNTDEMPKKAISMGIGTIMKAKSILLLGSYNKKDIIDKMLNDNITTDIPATMLKLHRDVTVIYIK